MALRRFAVLLLVLATDAGAVAEMHPTARSWASSIDEASLRFGIPQAWIAHVIAAESAGRTTRDGRPVRSPAGAIGLMQLMPATWAEMREHEHLGSNPDDPHDNIIAGTAYLRAMYDRFGYPGLFAAYNAGPERYAVALETGGRLPAETLAYLAAVTGVATTVPAPSRMAAMQSLFVVRHELDGSTNTETSSPGAGLFVAGSGVVSGR